MKIDTIRITDKFIVDEQSSGLLIALAIAQFDCCGKRHIEGNDSAQCE